MKRFMTYLMVFIALISVITGCKRQPSASATSKPITHEKSVSVESVVADVTLEFGINSPIPIDDQALEQFILATYTETDPPITCEDITEYYGLMCTSNVSSDFIVGIKTSSDKQEHIVDVLESVKATRVRSFDGYIDAEYQKANSASVLTTGDYTFLAILGNPKNGAEDNAGKVEDMILSYFD